MKRMKSIFGDDLWLEIMPHDFEEQRIVNMEIANLANDHSLPIDCHSAMRTIPTRSGPRPSR